MTYSININKFIITAFLISSILLAVSTIHAQKIAPSFDIVTGMSIATGEEISQVYGAGVGLALQGTIPLFKSRISLQPTISYNYFGNYYQNVAKDNLHILNLGGNILYNFKIEPKFYISPLFGIQRSSGFDRIGPQSGFSGVKTSLLSFVGPAFNVGVCFTYGKFFFQPGYIISSVNVTLDSALKTSLYNQYNPQGSIYPLIDIEDTKMSFNRFYFNIGYRITFSKK